MHRSELDLHTRDALEYNSSTYCAECSSLPAVSHLPVVDDHPCRADSTQIIAGATPEDSEGILSHENFAFKKGNFAFLEMRSLSIPGCN